MFDARLENYEVVACEDGFYALKEAVGKHVEGSILVLDSNLLLKADQWEEVPIYERERLVVKTDFGEVMAWAYMKDISDDLALVQVGCENYANMDEDVLSSLLTQFEATREDDLPPYDVYHFFKAKSKVDLPSFIEWEYGSYTLKVMLAYMEILGCHYLIVSMAVPIIGIDQYKGWILDHLDALEPYAEISSYEVYVASPRVIPFDKTYFFRRRMFLHSVKKKRTESPS